MGSKKKLSERIQFVLSNPMVYWRLLQYNVIVNYERFSGVDFTKVEQAPTLNLQDNRLNGYWSSANEYLESVLRSIEISNDDKMLDIGCGKGAAMRSFVKAGFGVVDGIEYTEKLSSIAKRNMKKLNLNCSVFNTDARLFDQYEKYNFFYLYNPFTGEIMQDVIEKIEETVSTNPRKIVIIYKNAVCDDIITSNRVFSKIMELKNQSNEKPFVIYTNFL